MKRIITAVIATMFLSTIAFAQVQPVKGTANLARIKPVGAAQPQQPTVQQPQAYSIPITQQLPLADGSGNTATVVVQTLTVTPQQLQSGIARLNNQIAQEQAQVSQLQAQLAAINALAAPATPVAVPATNTAAPATTTSATPQA